MRSYILIVLQTFFLLIELLNSVAEIDESWLANSRPQEILVSFEGQVFPRVDSIFTYFHSDSLLFLFFLQCVVLVSKGAGLFFLFYPLDYQQHFTCSVSSNIIVLFFSLQLLIIIILAELKLA